MSAEDEFRRMEHGQKRHFDEQIANFRRYYEGFDEPERGEFRAWLEKVAALDQESKWTASLRVKTEMDECDEAGEVVRWADTDLAPRTMLEAIKAWDAGQDYSPDRLFPY